MNHHITKPLPSSADTLVFYSHTLSVNEAMHWFDSVFSFLCYHRRNNKQLVDVLFQIAHLWTPLWEMPSERIGSSQGEVHLAAFSLSSYCLPAIECDEERFLIEALSWLSSSLTLTEHLLVPDTAPGTLHASPLNFHLNPMSLKLLLPFQMRKLLHVEKAICAHLLTSKWQNQSVPWSSDTRLPHS